MTAILESGELNPSLNKYRNKRLIVRLRAKVLHATGAAVHRHATIVEGHLVRGAQMPTAVYVEISEASTGFSLLQYDAEESCVADTWHPTVAEAMAQAKFEFGIGETGWIPLND